jgi:hypothetical protein
VIVKPLAIQRRVRIRGEKITAIFAHAVVIGEYAHHRGVVNE